MAYRIASLGFPFDSTSIFNRLSIDNDLLFRIIAKVVDSEIAISSIREADLVLVYPYVQTKKAFRIRSKLMVKLWQAGLIDPKDILSYSLGLKGKKVLVEATENLDDPYWQRFGWMLRISNLPRLTFWPDALDPAGKRFPFWHKYLDWPEFPRNPGCYQRFGRLYDLDRLMRPLPIEEREERALLISSHNNFFPRPAILSLIRGKVPVDIYGRSGIQFEGAKLEIMQKYKYCLTPENTLGFGYCTEKIPESWMAGCVPIGIFPQAFSDFNSNVLLWDNIHDTRPMEEPLLTHRPDLHSVVEYVSRAIHGS